MHEPLHPGVIALVFPAAMLAALFIGLRWGKRWPLQDQEMGGKFIDATMGLFGLLLAFTFSMALSRHDERRQAAVAHSTAVSEFFRCASTLKEPHRSRLRDLIREYAHFKLDRAHGAFRPEDREQAIQRSLDYYTQATSIVSDALAAGTPVAEPLVDALNNMASRNTIHRAAYRERLPWVIWVLLFFGSMVPAFLIGQRQAAAPAAHLSGTISFFILVTLVIYVIADLNAPTRGMIQVNQESLERVIQGMGN